MADLHTALAPHLVGYLDRRGRRWNPHTNSSGTTTGWTCDGLVYTCAAALDQLHGPLTALVTGLDDLTGELCLLRQTADRLTADLDEERRTSSLARDEADVLRAQVLHLTTRWRITWHALRLSNRALMGIAHTCPDHVREWRGDCDLCEHARLVARALVALQALDKPLPDPPIPLPPA